MRGCAWKLGSVCTDTFCGIAATHAIHCPRFHAPRRRPCRIIIDMRSDVQRADKISYVIIIIFVRFCWWYFIRFTTCCSFFVVCVPLWRSCITGIYWALAIMRKACRSLIAPRNEMNLPETDNCDALTSQQYTKNSEYNGVTSDFVRTPKKAGFCYRITRSSTAGFKPISELRLENAHVNILDSHAHAKWLSLNLKTVVIAYIIIYICVYFKNSSVTVLNTGYYLRTARHHKYWINSPYVPINQIADR